MNPVITAIKGMPPREAEEPAASESQLVHLRSFQIFGESTVRELGVLQASYLIDQAKRILEYEEAQKISAAKQNTKRGLGSLVVLVLILGAIFWGGKQYMGSLSGPTSPDPESRAEAGASPSSKEAREPVTPDEGHPHGVKDSAPSTAGEIGGDKKVQLSPDLNGLTTFAGLELPMSVRVVEALDLLNKVGKETTIPIGAIIMIEERKNLGSLTMKIEGETFVGNESRLLHKVRLP